MKRVAKLTLTVALAASGTAFGQSHVMSGMNMQGMDMNSCMATKGMTMATCQDMMKGMHSGRDAHGKAGNGAAHKTSAVVKAADPAKGIVTLAHEPVAGLNWPAMTMGFSVKDKALFDNLSVGRRVNVEFTQQGSDYVVTAVK